MSFTSAHVCKAFGLHPTTLRKWTNDSLYGLQLDADKDDRSGWRRFSWSDAVRLALIAKLIQKHRIEPIHAVWAVNGIHRVIAQWVPGFIKTAEQNGGAFREETCFVMLFEMMDGRSHHRVFSTVDELAEAGRNRSISGTIVFELWAETVHAASALQHRVGSKSDGNSE